MTTIKYRYKRKRKLIINVISAKTATNRLRPFSTFVKWFWKYESYWYTILGHGVSSFKNHSLCQKSSYAIHPPRVFAQDSWILWRFIVSDSKVFCPWVVPSFNHFNHSISQSITPPPPPPPPSNYLETWIICVHQFQGFRSMATSLRKTLHKDIFRDARFISIFYNRWHPIIDFCHKISRVYPKHDNQFIWILQCI